MLLKDFKKCKVTLLTSKFLTILRTRLDVVVIIFTLYNIINYYEFLLDKNLDIGLSVSGGDTWWKWQEKDDWSIAGNIPRFSESAENLSNWIPSDPPQLIKYPPISSDEPSNEKTIAFAHKPIEVLNLDIDPRLCGGKCNVEFNLDRMNKADAVVFSTKFPTFLPSRSFSRQLFVWLMQESPWSSYYLPFHGDFDGFKRFDDSFNLTMSYRRDADVYTPYNTTADVLNSVRDKNEKIEDILLTKTLLSVWVVGNCHFTKGSSARVRMMWKFIQLGLDVDIFGHCVNNPLPGFWSDLQKHLERYKFYFSFENSLHCRDYVTEKVWSNALSFGLVPVIWGPMRHNLKDLLPKNSYILVEDFKTYKDLVDYLKHLDQNDDEYLEYFKWRFEKLATEIPERNSVGQPWLNSKITGMCQLCRLLHEDGSHEQRYGNRPLRRVKSIYEWWYLEETKTCLAPYLKEEHKSAIRYTNAIKRWIWYNSFSTRTKIYYGMNALCLLLVIIHHVRLFLKRLGFVH